jgi:hypothetical protein
VGNNGGDFCGGDWPGGDVVSVGRNVGDASRIAQFNKQGSTAVAFSFAQITDWRRVTKGIKSAFEISVTEANEVALSISEKPVSALGMDIPAFCANVRCFLNLNSFHN